MEVTKSYIEGLTKLQSDELECDVYINNNLWNENMVLVVFHDVIDSIQIYHLQNETDASIYLLQHEPYIPEIRAYRIVKDIYGFYNTLEIEKFIDLIQSMSSSIILSSMQSNKKNSKDILQRVQHLLNEVELGMENQTSHSTNEHTFSFLTQKKLKVLPFVMGNEALEVKPSFITGLYFCIDYLEESMFYFNEDMLKDNILITIQPSDMDNLQIYHFNGNDAFIYTMVEDHLSEILEYRIVKDIYSLYKELGKSEFLNLADSMSLEIMTTTLPNSTEIVLGLRNEVILKLNEMGQALSRMTEQNKPSDEGGFDYLGDKKLN